MKAFLYYSLHALINQIKKLMKSWLMGIAIGLVLALIITGIVSKLDENEPTEPDTLTQEVIDEELIIESSLTMETKMQIVELVEGIIIIGTLVLVFTTSEKNGLSIFLPADVPALFASPWSEANVMLFRSFASMGAYLFLTVYFMVEIPTLKSMLNLSTASAAAVIFSFGLTLMFSLIINIYIYVLSSSSKWFKKYKTYLLFGILGAIALAFVLYYKANSLSLLEAAFAFFNSKYSRFVPIWGWLKGVALYAIEGNSTLFLLETVLCIAGIAAFFILIQHSKPDYYEEAMQKSEEVAALTEKMKSTKEIFFFKNSKENKKQQDKKEKLQRDGLNFGSGAAMYFFKSIYNRYRFAPLHFLTKTMQSYLLIAVLSSVVFVRFDDFPAFEVAMIILCVSVFFRSTGNPLKDDISNIYFVMSPDSSRKKLFFSLLGGSADCLMDLIPAALVVTVITKGSLPAMIGWVVFAVTLDFYSTCCGSFISVSLPESISMIVKQVIQICFIYFGMIPDILIAVFTVVDGGSVTEALLYCALVNLVLGFIFFEICIPFVEAHGGQDRYKGKDDVDLKQARADFSRVGFALSAFFVTTMVLQIAISLILRKFNIAVANAGLAYYLIAMGPMYGCGLPVCLLILKKMPSQKTNEQKPSVELAGKSLLVVPCIMMVGSIIGNLLTLLVTSNSSSELVNPVSDLLSGSDMILQIIFVVLFGPFMEELLFRKILIGKLKKYGEALAILVSSVLFGLFHGNFAQMFYAFGLGMVLGYIYMRTGSIKYSFALHATINLCNGVLPIFLLSHTDITVLDELTSLAGISPYLIAYLVYFVLIVILAIIGFVTLVKTNGKLRFNEAQAELPYKKRYKLALLSPGILTFVGVIAAYMVYYYCFTM